MTAGKRFHFDVRHLGYFVALVLIAVVVEGIQTPASGDETTRGDWYFRESLNAIDDWETVLAHWQTTVADAERTPVLAVPSDGKTVTWPNPIPLSLLPTGDRDIAMQLRSGQAGMEMRRVSFAKEQEGKTPFSPADSIVSGY